MDETRLRRIATLEAAIAESPHTEAESRKAQAQAQAIFDKHFRHNGGLDAETPICTFRAASETAHLAYMLDELARLRDETPY